MVNVLSREFGKGLTLGVPAGWCVGGPELDAQL